MLVDVERWARESQRKGKEREMREAGRFLVCHVKIAVCSTRRKLLNNIYI